LHLGFASEHPRINKRIAGKFRTPIEVPLRGRSLPVSVWPIGRSEPQHPRWQLWRHRWAQAFWNRAYKENITGLSGMVAYNLMLAVFPFALLVLFIFGQVVNSGDVERGVVMDIQRLFPNTEQGTLTDAIDRVRASSTTIGIAAVVGGIWIGASFWGAMDTAFCRIYHVECRGWVQQKRFSLVMLFGLLLLLLASVSVPTIESAVLTSTNNLPFGLSNWGATRTLIVVVGGLLATFLIISSIYWAVPKGHMPWRSVWPGALFFALVTSAGNYIFPLYLTSVSDLHRIGGTIGFILIALVWFYAISLALLAGAVINSLRHERDDTGALPVDG
jgi:YihY family inner membrane protein